MRIPDSVLEEIKGKVSIQDVISDHVTLQKKGSRLWGLCPFHTEKTPSFTVDEEKGLYYCYGCHKGGSVFTFLMEVEQVSFIESVKILAERAHVELPQAGDERQLEAENEQRQLMELYRRLTESFRHILESSPHAEHARGYLEDRRVPEEIQQRFSLGYLFQSGKWLHTFLTGKHYSQEFLGKSGLFSAKHTDYCLFSGRIIFPIRDHRGRVVAFGGRALKEGSFAKYINSPETSIFMKRRVLYGLHESLEHVRKLGYVIICEGYFDVMALHGVGIPCAAAPLGTACTEEHAYLIKRFCNEVHLLFDQDSAGTEALVKTLPIFERLDIRTRVITLPQGKDPADLLKEDPQQLKTCVNNPVNSFEYLVHILSERYDRSSPEGKHAVFTHMYPLLASTNSEIKREEYLRIASDHLHVDVRALYDDYTTMTSRASDTALKIGSPAVHKEIPMDVELYMLAVVFTHPKLFARMRSVCSHDRLKNKYARTLYLILEDAFRRGNLDSTVMLDEIEDTRLKSLMVREIDSGKYTDHPEKLLTDTLISLERSELAAKRDAVSFELKQLEKKQDAHSQQRMRELLFEKKFIDEEIERIRKSL